MSCSFILPVDGKVWVRKGKQDSSPKIKEVTKASKRWITSTSVNWVYSIGRVQTATLYMVYQRDQAIKNFKPEPYFELNAEILTNQQEFVAKLGPYQRFKDETGITFMQAKHVQKCSQAGLIKGIQNQAKKRASPQLFSLSSLQSAMNKRYHASASQTLVAIQSLYEDKLLSYPRTDCAYITDEEFDYLVANLTKYLGLVSKQVALTNTAPNKRYVNGKKVEEHYAIIMTKIVPTKDQLAALPKLQQQVLVTSLDVNGWEFFALTPRSA